LAERGKLAIRSAERKDPERSSVAPATTVVLARRLRSSSESGGNRGSAAPLKVIASRSPGFARLDHLQVLELLQPFVDQLVGEAAQPPADHLDVPADFDQGKNPAVVLGEIDLEGEIALADIRRQGFMSCGGEGVDQRRSHGGDYRRYRLSRQ
jgi:hypothetical protein